eukprot:1033369-Prymnesium_polylepis.1
MSANIEKAIMDAIHCPSSKSTSQNATVKRIDMTASLRALRHGSGRQRMNTNRAVCLPGGRRRRRAGLTGSRQMESVDT